MRLAAYVRDQADEARVSRVWSGLDSRLERRRRRRPVLRAGFAVAAVVFAAAAIYAGSLRVAHGPTLASLPVQVLRLADGSRVEHTADDHIEVQAVTSRRVELRLMRGRAHFQVVPNHARSFLTHAGGYTVRVVGTEYTVELADGGVRVQVTRGEVEIRRDGSEDVWRVHAGERWSSARAASRAETRDARQTRKTAHAAAEPSVTGAARVGSAGVSSTRVKPASPRPAVAVSAGSAPVGRDPAAARRASNGPAPRSSREPTVARKPERGDAELEATRRSAEQAARLFARAQAARLRGDRQQTARLLSAFLQRFAADSRASLCAFQLGRVRLELGDAAGALEALERARGSAGAFDEQVQARRVQALEQLGRRAECRAARAAFLRAYPRGTFAEVVRRRCP